MKEPSQTWERAALALALFSIDPKAMGGIWLRARVGPVRDRFLAALHHAMGGAVLPRIHPNIGDEALFGGLDLAATLGTGHLVRTQGLLAQGGVVILTMAERASAGLAARLGASLDRGACALIALDEGADATEAMGHALSDRLALHLDLDGLALGDAPEFLPDMAAIEAARLSLREIALPQEVIADLCAVAGALGIPSARAVIQAGLVARASAALMGEEDVTQMDVRSAVELVLAPRATQFPETAPPETPEAEPETAPQDPPSDQASEPDTAAALPPAELLLEAARAMLPPDLLARISAGRAAARQSAGSTGAGARKKGNARGRPLPAREGKLGAGARLDLVATLRAAAPWQKLRQKAGAEKCLSIRASDIRIRRFEERSDRAIIFLVDASGSSAMARMAEAKGAIELLLAEAYARRDHVALVTFRGTGAEVLLPPTRSLVQTKRRLQSLAGGGGTPLAAGLKAAFELGLWARGKGMTPSVALLTDGRANVALDGAANRAAAGQDATAMARALRAASLGGLVIDTGQRPTPSLGDLAQDMGAPYLPLPRADARSLSAAIEGALALA